MWGVGSRHAGRHVFRRKQGIRGLQQISLELSPKKGQTEEGREEEELKGSIYLDYIKWPLTVCKGDDFCPLRITFSNKPESITHVQELGLSTASPS